MAFGEGLMIVGSGILAVYPIFIAILLDIVILLAILKFAENSKHPFLTGFLLGSMFNNRQSYNSSPGSDYLALAILAPINAGLAVLLCLYLGMNLPLALMICLGPLGGALAFIAIGAIIKHISFGEAATNFARGVGQTVDDLEQTAKNGLQNVTDNTKSLWTYLAGQKPAVGIGLLLGVSLVVGVALLFHFGLPFYAYAVGFATVGALLLLGLGYIAKFAFEAINRKAEGGSGGEHPEVNKESNYAHSQKFASTDEQDHQSLLHDDQDNSQRKEVEQPVPSAPLAEIAEGGEPETSALKNDSQ